MARFHLFMYNSDESATILNTPVLTVEADQPPTELTREMMADIVFDLITEHSWRKGTREEVDACTMEQLVEWLTEDHCLSMTNLGIVPDDEKILNKLEISGDALTETFGDDSSCYRAAASFVMMVQLVEVGRLSIPMLAE